MIETHAHIYDETFAADREEMLNRAFKAGISELWMPNCNSETIEGMLDIARKYPNQCRPMMGLHPCYVKEDFEKELYTIKDWLIKEKFIAIGEIGMDLFWDKTYVKQQEEAFLTQCGFAKEHNLWIDIHSRNAFWETIALIERNADPNLKGIFHCFTGTLEEAQKAIELNFLLGIGGVATFKNGGLDKVLPHIDLKYVVLETDAPYLAPVPYRGKRNEPLYLEIIAQKVADLMHTSVETVLEQTTFNAKNLEFKSRSSTLF
jgi:TatD DNase family protein